MEFNTQFPFWPHLTDPQKEEIKTFSYTETFPKGTLMHKTEENCKGLMSVLSGQIRTYIQSDEGREVTLFRIFSGDVCVLSASCVMENIEFDFVIEAIEDTEVLVLPAIYLRKIMKENPQVELYLYKMTTEKFSEVMWTMEQILFQKTEQRVAGILWDEYIHRKTLTLTITHDEIAKYMGSAREVVTRTLKNLASQQIIELGRGKITILDKEKLKKTK